MPLVAQRARAALIAAALLGLAGCGDARPGESGSARGTKTSAAAGALAGDLRQAALSARARPRDADALARLIRLRFQAARAGGNYRANSFSAAGKAELRRAAADWGRYLALDPREPDVQLASLMVHVFDVRALNDPRRALRAQEIIIAQRRSPHASLYAQLALLHYRSEQMGAGDRAAARAVRLSPPGQGAALRRQLRQLRSQPASRAP